MKKGEFINNRYTIDSAIGHGSMGEVYLVRDQKLQTCWAAKHVTGRTDNELSALRSVNHPAFPRIVDYIEADDGAWIIMDYIRGISLQSYLMAHSPDTETIRQWSRQLAEALDYLHNMSPAMLYMDCKPANIIIDVNKQIRLVDFGSIYMRDGSECNRISGTRGYASPEQQTGQHVDIRSDVYSYGMTIKSMTKSYDTRRIFKDMINRCIRNNPAKRYQSMHEVLADLEMDRPGHRLTASIILKTIMYRLLQILLILFSITGCYTFTKNDEYIYLVLSAVLFVLFIALTTRYEQTSLTQKIICLEDIHLSQSSHILAGIIVLGLCIGLLAFDSLQATAKESDPNIQVTIYDDEGYTVLYRGQSVNLKEDGSISLYIPSESLNGQYTPARVEYIIE